MPIPYSLPLVQAEALRQTGHRLGIFVLPISISGPSIEARSKEIPTLLKAWGAGDEAALGRLTECVYPELRLIARRYLNNESSENTIQATALVHEVYLRLVDVNNV